MGLKDNDPAGTIARCQHTWPMLDFFLSFAITLKSYCASQDVLLAWSIGRFRAEG